MDIFNIGSQLETEKFIAEMASKQAAGVVGSFRNRAFVNAASATTLTGTPSGLFVASALVTCKTSGIFMAGVAIGWSGATNADTITWAVVSHTSSTGTVTGGAAAGVNCFTSNNATIGLTPLGAVNSIVQASEVNQPATGALAETFSWSGIIMNSVSTTVATGFTLGNLVSVSVAVSSAAGLALGNVGIYLMELP